MLSSKPLPQSFSVRKEKILSALSVPELEYDDLSPKGSIDAPIRELIDEMNALPGLVTTSSCSGRIAVYLEGQKRYEKIRPEQDQTSEHVEKGKNPERQPGGKGGGRWLYVSHEPMELESTPVEDLSFTLGMSRRSQSGIHHSSLKYVRWIHFKFEPFVCTHTCLERHIDSKTRIVDLACPGSIIRACPSSAFSS